ncbi:MAG: BMP family ABC transporter substrate-binding protein [Tissierellia bacterium]|nr:BMP family ABC transporter substrate-binding protein [Tissierellia bacterium]
MSNTKKFLSLLLALVLVFSFAACGKTDEGTKPVEENKPTEENKPAEETGKENEGEKKPEENEAALDDNSLFLITDEGTIDDKSFNQGSFEGLKAYADEKGVKANYLKPAGKGNQLYKQAIDQAIQKGAKVVVTPGFYFEAPVWEAQKQYPEVKFVGVDFVPKEKQDSEPEIAPNTVSVMFKEEQSGYLAGYAAVKDGYTKLGFMGGYPVPAVVKFGFGYIAGADAAAKELNKNIEIKFNYTNSFEAKPEIKTMASAWYKNGTEVIFSAGGGIFASVAKAAEEADTKVIGVDVDQGASSPTVITSAMKNLKPAVYESVKAAFEGGFKGGETSIFGVESKGVQISEDFSRFNKFTEEEYNAIYEKLEKNENGITDAIPTEAKESNPTEFEEKFANTKIEYVQQ